MQRLARPPVLPLLLCALLFGGTSSRAKAQTLQLPEHRQVETAPKAPLPAPLTPVHQDRTRHHPPVIAPRREPARHRPVAQRHPPHPAEAHRRATPQPVARPAAKPAPAHVAAAAVALPKPPVPAPDPNKGTSTGLPLPRFAALRTDETNLRAGPGMRYPIEWVYKRRYLPVEIEREFDVWRLVAMPDGTRGWVNQATLIGRRTFVVEQHDATLRTEPRDTAAAAAILKPGVIGRLRSCTVGADWCRVQVDSFDGYLPRDAIWGMLPHESVTP